ncbi:MAG: sugar ABC transporter ATP-binding protein [Deltaproteobacteria bacterium]|jgi:ribose transport system ATP-binding protein|nr:sugar ABC transporter ATP-binding protein [Deltaproteobacteria bacterium]
MDNKLVFQNISKSYPGVTALAKVSVEIRRGEVHALIGENGAGKSTLIKTCTGAVVPDSGKVIIDGLEFSALTPNLARENGIAVIYQEFNLVGELSVAENIFLGRAMRKGIRIDRKAMEREAAKIFRRFNININPASLVKDLTVGYQQIVEIAKAVSQKAKLLIMDEPSACLTALEVQGLFSVVDQLKAQGVTIIYISHRLDEIFRLCDRVTIMRDGHYVETLNTVETNVEHLVTSMVGRELKETYPSRILAISDEVILETKNLSGNGLKDVSFKLRRGEVLGLGGLIGAGRTELAELIFGVKRKTGGEILLKNRPTVCSSPQAAIRQGIALVPEDRKRQGALLDLDIKGNISMAILNKIAVLSVVNKAKERRMAETYKNDLLIKAPNISQKVKNLSGGNQQKVIIAKWLAAAPDIIIFDEPTRGIDVSAKYEIYKLINKLVESGKTLLLISSEMEELMGMADRILVLAEGRIAGELEKKDFNQERIMAFASGTKIDEAA